MPMENALTKPRAGMTRRALEFVSINRRLAVSLLLYSGGPMYLEYGLFGVSFTPWSEHATFIDNVAQ